MFQKSGRVQRFSAQIVIGSPQYLPGPAAQIEGDTRVGLFRQPHVIPVGVSEEDSVTAAASRQPGGLGWDVRIPLQRLPGIQQDLRAAADYLDQIAADLVRAAEDRDVKPFCIHGSCIRPVFVPGERPVHHKRPSGRQGVACEHPALGAAGFH